MTARILLAVVLSLLCAVPTWIPSSVFARGSGSSDSSEEYSSREEHASENEYTSRYRASKGRSHAKDDSDN